MNKRSVFTKDITYSYQGFDLAWADMTLALALEILG